MTRCLSVHAPYACAHSGACCRAGWTIAIEEPLVAPLEALGIHVGADRVAPRHADGQCVFFEAERGRLCSIHRRGGQALLPSACRHFPRVAVTDPRGTSITLSHFCPTAAGLLFAGAPLAIVDAPPGVALGGTVEGLDATGVLPPLLSHGVLTDWAAYSAWEAEAVALFNVTDLAPEDAADLLTNATERACSWKPGREPLAVAVRRAFAAAKAAGAGGPGKWGSLGQAVNAFLAAHAFASWAAYEPGGLRSVAAAVRAALNALTGELDGRGGLSKETLTEAIRATDLRLRHALRPESPPRDASDALSRGRN